MTVSAHFRQATPMTVEVRFFEGATFTYGEDPFIGSCNLHFLNGSVEVSLLHGSFGYSREAVDLVRDYLSERGYDRFHFEHHTREREMCTHDGTAGYGQTDR